MRAPSSRRGLFVFLAGVDQRAMEQWGIPRAVQISGLHGLKKPPSARKRASCPVVESKGAVRMSYPAWE